MRALALAALALAACSGGKDPCDGETGACVSVRLAGTVSSLDQLQIALVLPSGERALRTPSAPQPLTLPVRFAVLPPAGAPTGFSLRVDALAQGTVVASTPSTPITLDENKRASVSLALGAPRDGGTAPVSINPTSKDFGPVPRDVTQPPKAMFTVTNTSPAALHVMAARLAGADAGDFAITTSDCDNRDLAVMATCTLIVAFQPSLSTARAAQLVIPTTGGDGTADLTGTGTPSWNIEDAGGATAQLTGVWSSSSGDVWIVGYTTSGPVAFHGDGSGTWTASNNGLPGGITRLNAVWGASATNLYVVGDNGFIGHSAGFGSGTWTTQRTPAAGTPALNAVSGLGPNSLIAAGDAATVLRSTGDGNWNPEAVGGATAALHAAGVIGARWLAAGDQGTFIDTAKLVTINAGVTNHLYGMWSSSTDLWIVGASGLILHQDPAQSGGTFSPEIAPSGGDLHGIAGFTSGGALDLWAIGPADAIYHSDGKAIWTSQPLPPGGPAPVAVWASPDDGEVWAVGAGGVVYHLY